MRSRSIAAKLVVVDAVATPVATNPRNLRVRSVARSALARAAAQTKGSVVPTGSAPRTAVAHAPSAQVAQVGGAANARLANFGKALSAGRRVSGDPGAVLEAGDVAVLKLPNARHDVGTAARPSLGVAGSPVRVLAIGPGADVLADAVVPDGKTIEVPQGSERLVAIGQGTGEGTRSGLDGWHAGAQLPYLGWSSALGRGCLVRSRGEAINPHAERVDAGWVTGAELARGVSTVTTRFTNASRTVVIVLDDPTALGGASAGRRLVLALDGAERVKDARGEDLPPVLLASENRSVLAYAVAPTAGPVTVTVACEQGWSLVGVLASPELSPDGAVVPRSVPGVWTRHSTRSCPRPPAPPDWHGSRATGRSTDPDVGAPQAPERGRADADEGPLHPALQVPAGRDGRALRVRQPGHRHAVHHAGGAHPRPRHRSALHHAAPTRSCRASRRRTARAPSGTGSRRSC